MIKTTKCLLGITSMMLSLAVVRADTIETFTHTTATSSVPFTDTFVLPGFDTSLGTLDSITITFESTGTAQVNVINIAITDESFSGAMAIIPVTLTGPGPVTSTIDLSAGPFSGSAAPGNTPIIGSPQDVTNTVSVPSADFSLYEGVGPTVSVVVDAGTGTYSGSGAPGKLFFGGTATAGALTTVEYAYAPSSMPTVPEPASMTLLGGALLGICFCVKRFVAQR
jgi:hypothetical protein